MNLLRFHLMVAHIRLGDMRPGDMPAGAPADYMPVRNPEELRRA
jgi:hypothetical protein